MKRLAAVMLALFVFLMLVVSAVGLLLWTNHHLSAARQATELLQELGAIRDKVGELRREHRTDWTRINPTISMAANLSVDRTYVQTRATSNAIERFA